MAGPFLSGTKLEYMLTLGVKVGILICDVVLSAGPFLSFMVSLQGDL